MLAAVNPSTNGFGGGLLSPSGRPTAVGGGGFASPGTNAATPPGVPTSGIIEARNNSGSNVRIPYARLVPMHSRLTRTNQDKRVVQVDGKPELEYDGLRSGVLGFSLGRRFAAAGKPNDASRYSHMPYAGMGHGVDRMQRLASLGWIEEMVKQNMADKVVALHGVAIANSPLALTDSFIGAHLPLVAAGTLLYSPDPVHAIFHARGKTGDPEYVSKVKQQRASGVFVMEQGPFLRGMQVSTDLVSLDKLDEKKNMKGPKALPRNLGDLAAASRLELELRGASFMDWSPDGIVLSKLESPSEDYMTSTELDARSAQLFNVAVQGPAISTSWTSDYRESALECQPGDKVFVCIVATLSWAASTAVEDKMEQVNVNCLEVQRRAMALEGSPGDPTLAANLNAAIAEANVAAKELAEEQKNGTTPLAYTAYNDYTDALRALKVARKATGGDVATAETNVKTAKTEFENMTGFEKKWSKTDVEDFKDAQDAMRRGEIGVGKAYLANFCLVRSTSSHMSNYSHWDPEDPKSRCGLDFGKAPGDAFRNTGTAQYIVGAWCIGTVLDSAASRSQVGTLVRAAPTSMAMNIFVDVEWWSADKLYQKFMDKSGMVMTRGKKRSRTDYDNADKDAEQTANAG
jgi:hypothetical protein